MKNLGYIVRRLFGMNYKTMLQKINSIHKKTGRSRLWILRDMQRCAVNYGAGYMDYDLFEMYNLTAEQRDTYITRGRNNALVKQYNDMSQAHLVHNKDEFNALFGEFIARDWAMMANKEEALAFMEKHPRFILKPPAGSCGKGVEKVDVADYGSLEEAYETLLAQSGNALLEELIIQHSAVSAIYPHAINTVRCVTLRKNGTVHVITTCFRIGNHGFHVDNFNNGGMVAPVDEKTGIVTDNAIDKQKNLFAVHPMTGTPIKGFQFPEWEKAMDLCKRGAEKIPQLGYLAWDVAFSVKGPVLVECNEFPGHDLYQLPEHTPNKIGIMPKYDI